MTNYGSGRINKLRKSSRQKVSFANRNNFLKSQRPKIFISRFIHHFITPRRFLGFKMNIRIPNLRIIGSVCSVVDLSDFSRAFSRCCARWNRGVCMHPNTCDRQDTSRREWELKVGLSHHTVDATYPITIHTTRIHQPNQWANYSTDYATDGPEIVPCAAFVRRESPPPPTQ